MAKAKKPAAPKAAAKKNETQSAPAGTPTVDTNLAAESAARLLAAGVNKPAGAAPAPAKTESSMFKQMKSGLAKPASQAMSNLLDKHGGPVGKKSGTPFTGGKQTGHNQTFGADVNRSGVPRRTSGG